jgi:tartrate dehydrogenase/decarboxylase/D-malate dehydrogenase
VANPAGAIWAASMLLEHAGHDNAGRRVLAALEEALAGGARTPDLGGSSSTEEVTEAVIRGLDAPGGA